MSVHAKLYSEPSGNVVITFEQNPGCCLRKNRLKVNWKKELDNFENKYKCLCEKSELEILARFLNSLNCDKVPQLGLCWVGHHSFKHRSKFWSCMNMEEKEYRISCHEAGHIVSYWFTEGPKELQYATIIPAKEFIGRVQYKKLDPNYVYTNDDWFSEMCCYLGGELGEKFIACKGRFKLCDHTFDMIVLAKLCYRLAKNTMEEAGEEGPEELMLFFFRKCLKVTKLILHEHRRDLLGLSYALFAEKNLDYWDVFEILGPRPQMNKTLYEEFVMDEISNGQFKENSMKRRIKNTIRKSRRREIIEIPTIPIDAFIDFSDLFTEEKVSEENLLKNEN